MSQEAVELVRRYYERLNARDAEGCLELLDPDVEIAQPHLPDGGTYRGAAGWRSWIEALDAAWSDLRWETQTFVDARDAVLVSVRFVSTGSHTAIEHATQRFHVFRLRDGRIVFMTGYGRRTEAVKALGLSE
jgi:ketosteroid isomerase-like protein